MIAYTHEKVGDSYHIKRENVHVATYDPVTEETSYTKKDNERYSAQVLKEVKEITEGKPHANPAAQKQGAETTPAGPAGYEGGPEGYEGGPDGYVDPRSQEDIDTGTEPKDNVEIDEDDDEPGPTGYTGVSSPAAGVNGPTGPAGYTDPVGDENEVIPGLTHSGLTVRVAAAIYGRYCESVGGVAFNGDKLPGWDEFARDPAKVKQRNAWLDAAETAIAESGPDTETKLELTRLRRENAQMGEELRRAREGGNNKIKTHTPERYRDEVDLTGAPVQDKNLGDLTPSFIEWARENFSPELFTKRYRGRIAGV